MERRLTEEQITKAILVWLDKNSWKVVSFDFPQSGTGIVLHPNDNIRESTKNKGAFIPDIVAVKENVAVFFENKDRFVFSDFEKVNELRRYDIYSSAINSILEDYEVNSIFYGVGVVLNKAVEKRVNQHLEMIDFAVYINENKQVTIGFQSVKIF